MRLAHQLIVALSLCLVVMLGIAGAVSVHREDRLIERDLTEDLLITGRSLRPAFVHIWKTEGREAALDLFDYTGTKVEHFDRLRARWTELDAPPGSPQHLDAGADVRETLVRNLPAGRHSDENGGALVMWVPVQVDGIPNGALELRRTIADEKMFLAESTRNVCLFTVALWVAMSVLVLVAGRWLIGRPIKRLEEHARHLAGGDLEPRPLFRQPTDLARVARALNETGAELQKSHRRVADEHAARIAALEQLRHADRLATLGTLSAGIAHELGTPLTVVSGRAKMVAARHRDVAQTSSDTRIICEQSQRMANLVRQLLDFSRQGAGEKLACDLLELTRSTVELLTPLATRRQVDLAFVRRAEIAPALAVAAQVGQVLTNLIVNGLQATPAGGHVQVRVGQRHVRPPTGSGLEEGDFAFIEIEDDGVGIAPEHLGHVFDPFFTTKPPGEGTGLGLSVAYGIAREHGGWIDVSSAPSQGSRFSLHLPVARDK